MSEMVERVAKAIYDAPGPDGDHIAVYLSDSVRIEARNKDELRAGVMDVCRAAARAAIQAMREPTEGMRRMFYECALNGLNPEKTYRVVIDAALHGSET